MLFKHYTRKGDLAELRIADEAACHLLMDVVNLDREKLRRACLSAEEMATMLRTHNIVYVLVRGEVAGVCIYQPGPQIVVDWLGVIPEYQRQGVATYLLRSISTGLSGKGRSIVVHAPEHADALIRLLHKCKLQSQMDTDDPTVYVFTGTPKYVFSSESKLCA